jgi:hypothetical protein
MDEGTLQDVRSLMTSLVSKFEQPQKTINIPKFTETLTGKIDRIETVRSALKG